MIIDFYVYNNANGEVLRSGRCAESDLELQSTAQHEVAVLGAANDLLQRHRLVENDLVSKVMLAVTISKVQIESDGVDESVLTSVPGCDVVVDGESMPLSDGVLEFSTDMAGTYSLIFSHCLYLSKEVSIEAIA